MVVDHHDAHGPSSLGPMINFRALHKLSPIKSLRVRREQPSLRAQCLKGDSRVVGPTGENPGNRSTNNLGGAVEVTGNNGTRFLESGGWPREVSPNSDAVRAVRPG